MEWTDLLESSPDVSCVVVDFENKYEGLRGRFGALGRHRSDRVTGQVQGTRREREMFRFEVGDMTSDRDLSGVTGRKPDSGHDRRVGLSGNHCERESGDCVGPKLQWRKSFGD